MSTASSIWAQLRAEYPDRAERVADQVEPVAGATQDFVERLLDLRSTASIGNGKSGYIGNPYEQPAEDMAVLLCAAERISGLVARPRSERPNNSFKPNPLRGSA